MNAKVTENDLELAVIEQLESQGYEYIYAPDIAPDSINPLRSSFSDVLIESHLEDVVRKLNPSLPPQTITEVLRAIRIAPSQDLLSNNEHFHTLLTDGVAVEYKQGDKSKGDIVKIFDFENPKNNRFVVANQFTIIEDNHNRRPDVIIFVNGIPLVVMELKNPVDENADTKKAFNQFQTYKKEIPSLFNYNNLLIISDGLDAGVGSLSAPFSRFLAWKSVDGTREEGATTPQLETLIKGMLRPQVVLDLLRNFTIFEKTKKEDPKTKSISVETIKKVSAYHQYYAVNKAVESTKKATADKGDRKAGVVWHTQGSGKSLSMVFYTGKLVQALNNPTILVLTDRNDLDDQLFDTFGGATQLLRQTPVQANDRSHLRELLKVNAGGIVFTTIHKFSPADGETLFPLLSDRKNIVVVADEAHRSQYGFSARTIYIKDKDGNEVGSKTAYGFAKYMRDALPNASFIGFTGTPVESEDANTPAVFGNYIDIYDISQAVEDGATTKIFYESRLVKMNLKDDQEAIDKQIEEVAKSSEEYDLNSSKSKWSRIEAIAGHPKRLAQIAEDIINHFETRQEAMSGKAMTVCMSRRISVNLFEEIVKIRPDWEDDDIEKGQIKVIMTSSASDDESWQKHFTTKQERKRLADRVRDPSDPLKMVIVRDMWLTGFDAPCLNTLYVDKPMQGHNLMQAIARVNRVYGDKPGGLVVDYIGIATNLKSALHTYTNSGGKGNPTEDLSDAICILNDKLETIQTMYQNFNFKRYFTADTSEKLKVILEGQEHILGIEDGRNRYLKEVNALSKAFALCSSMDEAKDVKDEVAFYQAVKARLSKFTPSDGGKSAHEVDNAVREIVEGAVVADGIIDIFDASGIKKPDISVLSDDFLQEVKGMEHKNVALELLKKLLNDELKTRTKSNLTKSRTFSEMLDGALKKYQNQVISTAEVIEELIQLAKELRDSDKRGDALGLNKEELAFYDALSVNDSAQDVMGEEELLELARMLLTSIKRDATIDWQIKENVRAKLRIKVRRLLKKYGYPPDMEAMAIDRVMEQSELMASELVDEG